MKRLIVSLIVGVLLVGCTTVAPYQRQYVSDPEMQMGDDAGKQFNSYVYSIREGATPAVSAKSSGGCGCN